MIDNAQKAIYISDNSLRTAEHYDPVNKQWNYIAPMKNAHHHFRIYTCNMLSVVKWFLCFENSKAVCNRTALLENSIYSLCEDWSYHDVLREEMSGCLSARQLCVFVEAAGAGAELADVVERLIPNSLRGRRRDGQHVVTNEMLLLMDGGLLGRGDALPVRAVATLHEGDMVGSYSSAAHSYQSNQLCDGPDDVPRKEHWSHPTLAGGGPGTSAIDTSSAKKEKYQILTLAIKVPDRNSNSNEAFLLNAMANDAVAISPNQSVCHITYTCTRKHQCVRYCSDLLMLDM
uniref:BACK domain-containing protein n=1 Tax=Glossina palpalis gambiensis TaxID=67801 RepID=A0A1B0BFY4_9MUSC